MDGLAGLWNVLIGHGNQEMADAAQRQMVQMAYSSNYVGTANLPAIELAERLAGFAYSNLNYTYFASGGAEANESAFKTARYYWKRMGKPDKVKVIARQDAYHGVTLAAMSATGIAPYWHMFEPRVPNFLHIVAPYPYRFEGDVRQGETIGQAAARALEEAILREGADTVAAFIAEPVQGAGGVLVPPDDYFPHIRAICDKYEVLLIADEVITGFGRTGEWFALNRYGIQPDIMSFAKGITSGYLPLGGIQISDDILALMALGYKQVDARKAIRKVIDAQPEATVEELVRGALRSMQ
jgi:adenosylmethionine-8-amino-7-oxononanoate aminotransferase